MTEVELGGLHERENIVSLDMNPLDESLQDLILGCFAQSFLVGVNAGVPQILTCKELKGSGNLGEMLTLQGLTQWLDRWVRRPLMNFLSGAIFWFVGACGCSYPCFLFRSQWNSFHFNFGEWFRQNLLHGDIFALEQLSDQRIISRDT